MKNFTNNFKQFTSRLSARWLIMALMLLLGTSSAWGWSYKTAKENWACRGNTGWSSQTIYTTPTGSSTKTGVDVVMMENPGSGFNIIQNDNCSGQQLYIGLTGTASSSTSTIVRATAYWNNGLYSTYTVVIPEGKIYIKPTNGSAVEMTKSRTYSNSSNTTKLLSACTYTASITLSSAKTFDLYATDPGATISNESSMPAAGKPSTVRLNYTGLTSPYQYVKVTYNLITNQITFTEDTPPCTTVSATQYPISPVTFTYNGNKQVPTITPAAGAGDVTSTVYKQGNTTVASPINVGTYDVYVTSNNGTTYCGASNLKVGSFEIKCATATSANFTISNTTFTFDGNKHTPTVTPKAGVGAATITYKQGNNTVADPINAGTYDIYVTTNAGTGYCAITTATKIGTFTIDKKTVAKEQYTISPTTFTYNGSKQVPTINPASGAGTVTSTVYKLNNTTTVENPTDAGTYTVYVTSNAGTNYTAASSLNIGTFKINQKAPTKADFSYVAEKNYTGSALSADVAWKSGTGTGAITTYYKVKNSNDNTYTTTAPSAAGTYTIAVTTVAGGNYAAATTKIVLGDFTINEVCEPIASLYWEITDGKKEKYCPGDEVSVKITYKGTTAKAYQWGGNYNGNIGISDGNIASGAVYTMTINKSGTVNLTLTDCDGGKATTTTLEFTTHEAPATPTIAFSVNPVGQSKETTLSIASYSADNNYIVYRSADNAVGNDTEVGAYTAPMNISHNNTGSYYYYAKATNKSCANLTATSAIVKLDVQEAGATIASLGDLKIDAQDPVDFVAMYVKNDGLADFSAQGATKVTGYTWQFSSDDGKTWTDCASTNTVAGVNYAIGMANGSDKCNNFRPNVSGQYRCKVTYDKGEQTSNVLEVTANGTTAKTFKGVTMTLPVVSVNTGALAFPVNNFGGTPSKNADKMKEKISVDVKIFENINGTTQVVYDRKARMNYRGSSSLNFLKKSYAFVTGKEKTKSNKGDVDTGKENLLGIGSAKDKDWVLYAAAADPSLMRNRLMFDTYKEMTGGWGVSSRYVELVVNGEYKGVYVMMDKITANKDRVNIEWKLDDNGNTTQEAFIVKFDKTDRADRYENTSGDQKTFKSKYSGHDGFDTYDTNIDQRFEVEYPEKEDIEDGKGKWSEVFNAIENKINKFEEELAKGNFSEVQKLIDYTSWADWFIITEFAKNIDGYRASNIFVYDGSKANAKIEARPLWDQELSFNNQCPSYYADYGSNSTSGLLIDKSNSAVYNNDASAPFWFTGKYKGDRGKYNGSDQTFKGLLDDPCFQAEVQARWAKHIGTNGALTSSALTTKMTGYLKDLDKNHELSSSAITSGTPLDREFNTFWKNKSRATIDCGTGSGCYDGTTGYTDPTFHNSKVSLNNWLTGNRRTNLGNIINGWKGTELNITLTITPETGITTPWEAVMVQVNNPSGYDYDLEYTTNTLDKVSGVIINENNDKYTYRIPRPEAWKPGDEEKDGERTDIQYGIKATLKVGEGVAQCGNSSQAPSATTTITLQDEANENCPK